MKFYRPEWNYDVNCIPKSQTSWLPIDCTAIPRLDEVIGKKVGVLDNPEYQQRGMDGVLQWELRPAAFQVLLSLQTLWNFKHEGETWLAVFLISLSSILTRQLSEYEKNNEPWNVLFKLLREYLAFSFAV